MTVRRCTPWSTDTPLWQPEVHDRRSIACQIRGGHSITLERCDCCPPRCARVSREARDGFFRQLGIVSRDTFDSVRPPRADHAPLRSDGDSGPVSTVPVSAGPTPMVERLRLEQGLAGDLLPDGRPRVSWWVTSKREAPQKRFQIELIGGTTPEVRTVHGADHVLVDWPFDPLPSRFHGSIRVRSDLTGYGWTPWSERALLEVGLLDPEDWVGDFIVPTQFGGLDDGAPVLFTTFELDDAPVSSRLYITASGVYEAHINGRRAGVDVFAPGWTAYHHRTRFQAYDVVQSLVAGANELSVTVGNGWFRGQLAWPNSRDNYGSELGILVQLEVKYANGTTRVVSSDDHWQVRPSEVLFDDFYNGEVQDLRRINHRGADVDPAPTVVSADAPTSLVARRGPAVRVAERVQPISITTTPSGVILVDFGQNLVGWVELTVHGMQPGDEVTIRHAEVLEGGELALTPLRTARAQCSYYSGGGGEEVLRPRFTFSGFRYATVSGLDRDQMRSVSACVIGTALERIGWLETSNEAVNRLHENVVWSARGNFLDIPTDCPQRDERLGWTGDVHVFAPTASFLFDTAGFLAGWLEDLALEQHADGCVPFVIPDTLHDPAHPSAAGWADAAVSVPWALYIAYGDEGVLRRQYLSMCAWIGRLEDLFGTDSVWRATAQFGDWLDPDAPPDEPATAKADVSVVATAHAIRSATLAAQTARTLNEIDDALHFEILAERWRTEFESKFVSKSGIILSDCQTVYALALAWDLLSTTDSRRGAGQRLAALVEQADGAVSTGFLGTPVVLEALSRSGRTDLAYRMLLRREAPSWLYPVTMGATTIWERWDSMLPDGSVNPGLMTSFNHYAYGAVADWMHRRIGGIEPAAPAYRRFIVRPVPTPEISFANARHQSPYGEISVSWKQSASTFHLELTVPNGTTASVCLPHSDHALEVTAGEYEWTVPN